MTPSTSRYAPKAFLRNPFLFLVWVILLHSCHLLPEAAAQANSKPADPLAARIKRVENGLTPVSMGENEPPVRLTLEQLMGLYKVSGLSLAVIDDFKVAWVKGYGVTEAGAATPVTTRTLFMAGSIAKTPTAAAALALVEQGKLSLDEDVNQRLKTWKVPENEFTTQQKVTLRRILSHSAGLTVHGFPGYTTSEQLPTLVQVLNGEKPANTAPVRVDFVPGTKWRYSGGGVMIEQQLMMDVTGKQFPELMGEIVFDKIGMNDSTYEEPLPPARAAQAASGTYASGKTVPGKWHVYREMAAGGLWTTPTDLAKFAIEIALSKQGKSNRILTEAMTREMLKAQMDRVGEVALGDPQHVDRMGLGFFLGDASRPDLFGHIGDDEGFQAMLYMFGDSGQGAVIMANSQNGILLGDLLLSLIAKEYGWKNFVPSNRPRMGSSAVLLSAAQQKGVKAAIQVYGQLKKMESPEYALNEETLIGLGYSLLGENKPQDAIEIMKLEVHEYPNYWNGYDSLGELYMNVGEKKLAIENYKKSVELNPGNHSGIEALKKLTAGGERN
jgi:CubicO group peptidase (beta-lactamase class C family)